LIPRRGVGFLKKDSSFPSPNGLHGSRFIVVSVSNGVCDVSWPYLACFLARDVMMQTFVIPFVLWVLAPCYAVYSGLLST
jgi:hypothetical protein